MRISLYFLAPNIPTTMNSFYMNIVADVNFGILSAIVTNELHVSSKYVTMFYNIN